MDLKQCPIVIYIRQKGLSVIESNFNEAAVRLSDWQWSSTEVCAYTAARTGLLTSEGRNFSNKKSVKPPFITTIFYGVFFFFFLCQYIRFITYIKWQIR